MIKSIGFFVCLALMGYVNLFGQPFYANYDPSPGNSVYFGGFQEILPSGDGGFIALAGPYEKVLAKFDAQMELVWAQKFNLPGAQFDYALTDLAMTADDKILVMGYYFGTGPNLSVVAKFELDGTLVWKKDVESLYASCGFHLIGANLLPAPDNGFYMFGSTSHERSMVLRFDANGDAIWGRVVHDWNDTFSQRFQAGALVNANSLMLLSNMSTISWFELDANGNFGNRKIHDMGKMNTGPSRMLKATNGDFFSYGITFDTVTWVMSHQMARFTPSGDLVWAKDIEASAGYKMEEPHAFFQSPNGELVAMGCVSFSSGSGRRLMVSRYDLAGNHLGTSLGWDGGYERIYGGMAWNGSLYLAGVSITSRNFLARLDLVGSGFCNADSTVFTLTDVTPSFVLATDSITVEVMPTLVTPATWDLSPYTYTRTVLCGNPMLEAMESEAAAEWMVAPQPSSGEFELYHPSVTEGSWQLYDLQGAVKLKGGLNAHGTHTRIGQDGLIAGMYLLDIEAGDLRKTLRIIVE